MCNNAKTLILKHYRFLSRLSSGLLCIMEQQVLGFLSRPCHLRMQSLRLHLKVAKSREIREYCALFSERFETLHMHRFVVSRMIAQIIRYLRENVVELGYLGVLEGVDKRLRRGFRGDFLLLSFRHKLSLAKK